MDESILNTTKKLLGIQPENTCFDLDILVHINSAISSLTQIGVGPEYGFVVEDADVTYKDYLGDETKKYQDVKLYICQKVRLGWDPPANSTIVNTINDLLSEIEYRIWFKANLPNQKEGDNSK